jgi:hypothetical protein
MAEVVVDVLNGALGVEERYGSDAPSGRHMVEVGPSRLQNSSLMYVLRTFGRPPRTTACDCERAMDPALPQTLIRMTDPAILSKLQDNQGRVARLAGSKMPLEEACRELFLAALSREPNADEMASVRSHIAAESDRREVLTDVMWALVNTREFILNH